MGYNKDDWARVEARPVIDSVPDEYVKGLTTIADKANKATVGGWKDLWAYNAQKNRHYYDFHSNSVKKLKGIAEGKTAYLVGNGPSLSSNVDCLKDKDGIILTGIHSLGFLKSKGIVPDFVVVCDALRKMADFIGDFDTVNTPLISDIVVAPVTLNAWKGPKYFFTSLRGDTEVGLDKVTDFSDFISCGGHAIGAAWAISHGMGCRRFVFCGCDYSNGLDYMTQYADGSQDERTGYDSFIVADIRGIGVLGTVRMWMYKLWLDGMSKAFTDCEFINATEGGCLGAYPEGNLSTMKIRKLSEV